ncbi:hypothetical protein Pfo_031447 [Paulownia fortunei]|nr:hypothetical protein Pfo_031447 [Paulownia fortunei]
MVKYLGIGPFTIYDAINTYQTSQVRKSATPSELTAVQKYIKKNYAAINPEFYGKAKGKNVIVIHLESFQQMSLDLKINGQETSNTGSTLVDNYFITNHYLDQSVKEFFNYLKKSGLYDNTAVVLYGDHYGISNTDAPYLASVLGKSESNWNDLDNANLQRVPLIVHIPGMTNGYIDHTYGGEIDVAPTLEHLLGISTKRYIQFGQDLLSKQHVQIVAFRNKDWITPEYASLSGRIWNTKTNQLIEYPDKKLQAKVNKIQSYVNKKLDMSDNLNQKNLLRFYTPKGFKAVDPSKYD